MKKLILGVLLFLILPASSVSAQENKFITIVNPIRISAYSTDPQLSLTTQYQAIKQRDLAATWLFSYDSLRHEGIQTEAIKFDINQEKGVLLEVTPKLAEDAGVVYIKTDSWHRANSVFLSGYSQSDRIKLIHTIFNKYFERYNTFPVVVGGWWVDSYSLKYMHDKYGITSVLTCSDQFSTDGYQIWGQYFSVPFYSSLTHAGVSAQSSENKIGTVTLQWAMRDPLNGYLTPTNHRASLYSTQDYFTIGLDELYLEKLASVYLNNPQNKFGQITFGLEGDFLPGAYMSGNYISELNLALKFKDTGVEVVTMSQFSDWYSKAFPGLSPSHIIETDDLLGQNKKAIWYQSPFYRAGLVIDKTNNTVDLLDFRLYSDTYNEPYYYDKNFYSDLEINIPSLIDTVSNKNEKIVFAGFEGESTEGNSKVLKFNASKQISLNPEAAIFSGFEKNEVPEILQSSINFKNASTDYILNQKSDLSSKKYTYLSINILQNLTLKKTLLMMIVLLVVAFVAIYFIRKNTFIVNLKLALLFGLVIFLIVQINFARIFHIYEVNGEELSALEKLKTYPSGKVLVLQQKCLNCQSEKPNLPLAFAGNKKYVTWLSGKDIVESRGVIATTSNMYLLESELTRDQVYQRLIQAKIKYIYLVKYDGYHELLPYSPGDLKVERIFNNAHVEIWQLE